MNLYIHNYKYIYIYIRVVGIFLQRSLRRGQEESDDTDNNQPPIFGARCLALFSDGRGAYAMAPPRGLSMPRAQKVKMHKQINK